MPGTIRAAVATDTFPLYLSTKFSESHNVQANWNEYNDGSTERGALVTEGRRSWKLSKRLVSSDMVALRTFWENHPSQAFYFFNPSETTPPYSRNPVGTNGRYIVRFASDWSQTMSMVRGDADVELIELAAEVAGYTVTETNASGSPLVSASLVVIASFTVDPSSPDGRPTIDLLYGNTISSQVASGSGVIGTSPTTLSYSIPTANLGNFFNMSVRASIIGTLGGAVFTPYRSTLNIYDVSVQATYQDTTTGIVRPTATRSVTGSGFGIFYGGVQGNVVNAAAAIDSDSSTFASVTRDYYGSLADPGYLQVSSFQFPAIA